MGFSPKSLRQFIEMYTYIFYIILICYCSFMIICRLAIHFLKISFELYLIVF